MKKRLKIAVLASAVIFMLIPDVIYSQYGVRRRTRRRTAVVVGSTAHAVGAAQGSAAQQQQAASAQQQAATAEQQAATAEQQAAAADQRAAAAENKAAAAQQQAATAEQRAVAAEREAAVAKGLLPLGTVASKLPAGCSKSVVSNVVYYKCGVNYYRAVFQGNDLVYVTAQPK